MAMTDATTVVSDLKKLVSEFVAARDWQPFHDPKNLSASIAIEAAELMEHFQWLRSDELAQLKNDAEKMREIEEELADITAYVVSFASTMDIDLSSALQKKMKINALKYPIEQCKGRAN